MDTLKFKLVIAYDGTAYQGWQVQKIGTGVQEKVETVLARYFPSKPRLHSSSRTDTGVHALGMVAHFEIPKAELIFPVKRLAIALNAFLPDDIRVLDAARVHKDFHARFHAKGKQYRYHVWNHHAMNPLLQGRAWHVPRKIDFAKVKAAAKLFVGKHDFKSFAVNHPYEMDSTVRTLTRCEVKRSGANITFIIEGDGFLYRMCRGIVGTIVQVGYGRFSPEDIKTMLAKMDRRAAGMSAPAQGLVLWKVFYGKAVGKHSTPNIQRPTSRKASST
ncbi:MAG TPA: tRNA pseudouridine(38-40) synthase TruA [Verrucomicrobiae bacterium]|nr:tRNA pseudouridine(38-40) synthase TruA [Verrucomicrobiae bacterium]